MKKIWMMVVCLTLTLTAAPSLSSSEPLRASPPHVNFGTHSVGAPSTRTVKIRNVDTEAIFIFHFSSPAGFSARSLTCFDGPLQPKKQCEIEVRFTPGTAGNLQGNVLVQYCLLSDPICPGAVFGQEQFILIPVTGRGRSG